MCNLIYNGGMENKENNTLKTLAEIVSGLSEEIDNNKHETNTSSSNFFANPVISQPSVHTENNEHEIVDFNHKINNLESEFYAPNTVETVFSNDILLEQKIIKLKKELEVINHKIIAERNFENTEAVNPLVVQKKQLQNELNNALKEYKNIPVGIKIKNKIVYAFKFVFKCIAKLNFLADVQDYSFSANQPLWKKNLQKLNKINKEIDDIMKTNTPYGEQEDRYKKLSKSLNKALDLRNSINKEI